MKQKDLERISDTANFYSNQAEEYIKESERYESENDNDLAMLCLLEALKLRMMASQVYMDAIELLIKEDGIKNKY